MSAERMNLPPLDATVAEDLRGSVLWARLCKVPREYHDHRDGRNFSHWSDRPDMDMNLRGRDLR